MTADLAGHLADEDPRDIPDAVRLAVLDRDDARCRVCARTSRLQLHHVLFRSRGGGHAPENLVTLCAEHHEAVHAVRLDVQLLEAWPGRWECFWRWLSPAPSTTPGPGSAA